MPYVLHFYRMTYKTYDMQEYIFVHPEEWHSRKTHSSGFFSFSSFSIKKTSRSLEALRLQPLGRTTAVCFSMVLDFIQTIRRTLGKHDQLGIANKMRRQPITATLGKLYVVTLFISHTHQGHSPTHLSFCTLHDS